MVPETRFRPKFASVGEVSATAQVTGVFQPAMDPAAAERRRAALAEHQRLTREIAVLRASASRETQLNRRVELNLELKRLESYLAEAARNF